ncbi:hypothetical protein [Pseudooceanicola sp.]|uniref:crAss001_48 related protein n=1 Tax=Pseudooceanicola sp. TaxID=1914328 RepID=UPI00351776C7
MPLQPHEERVLAERAELADKCVKLEAFIVSDAFKAVDILDRDLLEEQHNAMTVYLAVLDRRIARFAPKSS